MNNELKVGDTCVVVKCRTNPGYIGMSVELVRKLSAGERFDVPGEGFAFMGQSELDIWVVKGGPFSHKFDEEVFQSAIGSFAERCLLKISGEPDQSMILVGRVLDKSYRFMPVRGV